MGLEKYWMISIIHTPVPPATERGNTRNVKGQVKLNVPLAMGRVTRIVICVRPAQVIAYRAPAQGNANRAMAP